MARNLRSGTVEQFIDEVNNRISELEGSVDFVGSASINSNAVPEVGYSKYDYHNMIKDLYSQYKRTPGARAGNYDAFNNWILSEYLVALQNACEDELSSMVDDIVWRNTSNAIYLSVTYLDNVTDFTIPLSDLSIAYDDLDDDASYIVQSVLDWIENI